MAASSHRHHLERNGEEGECITSIKAAFEPPSSLVVYKKWKGDIKERQLECRLPSSISALQFLHHLFSRIHAFSFPPQSLSTVLSTSSSLFFSWASHFIAVLLGSCWTRPTAHHPSLWEVSSHKVTTMTASTPTPAILVDLSERRGRDLKKVREGGREGDREVGCGPVCLH